MVAKKELKIMHNLQFKKKHPERQKLGLKTLKPDLITQRFDLKLKNTIYGVFFRGV